MTALQISSAIKCHPPPSPIYCLFMPLNMELPLAHSNAAAVEGAAWPVMGFSSHQQMRAESPGRVVLSAGCSHFSRQHCGDRPAPRTTPPSHTSHTHTHTSYIGRAPKRASGSPRPARREHMVRQQGNQTNFQLRCPALDHVLPLARFGAPPLSGVCGGGVGGNDPRRAPSCLLGFFSRCSWVC
jgi:hypothetical protein